MSSVNPAPCTRHPHFGGSLLFMGPCSSWVRGCTLLFGALSSCSELTLPVAVLAICIAHVLLPSACDSLSDAQGLAVANMHRDELWLTLTLHRDELCLTCTCGKHVADCRMDLWAQVRPPALSNALLLGAYCRLATGWMQCGTTAIWRSDRSATQLQWDHANSENSCAYPLQ